MYCEMCGKKLQDGENCQCNQMGKTGKGKNSLLQTIKRIIRILLWIMIGTVLVSGLGVKSGMGNARDGVLETVSYYIDAVLVFIIPTLVLMNFMGIRNRLPLFKKRKFLVSVMAFFLLLVLLSVIDAVALAIVEDMYSAEYQTEYEKQQELLVENNDTIQKNDEEPDDFEQQMVSREEKEEILPETVIKAVAENGNDLTGTYVDEELGEKIVIIQRNGKITYNYSMKDGSGAFIEEDCTIESSYIAGQFYYITKNMDGSLAISSGAGGTRGHFVKTDDEAIIDLADSYEEEEFLTYDFYTDVENGVLYVNQNGNVTDVDGTEIEYYAYIEALENGTVNDGENIIEGITVSNTGQLILDIPKEVEDDDSNTSMTQKIALSSGHYTNSESPIVFTIEDAVYTNGLSDMFVYIKVYYGTLDNLYANEYMGMINLFDIGTVTLQDGIQNAYYFDYDENVIEGYGLGTIARNYCDKLDIRYDSNASTTYYLDNELSATKEYEDNQVEYAELYESVVKDVEDRNGRYSQYSMYDMNQDGYLELFIQMGDVIEIYTTDGKNASYMGKVANSISGSTTSFYEYTKGAGVFISKNLDKVGRIVYLVTYENGEIVEKMVAQGVDYYGKVDGMGESLPGSLICNGLYW